MNTNSCILPVNSELEVKKPTNIKLAINQTVSQLVDQPLIKEYIMCKLHDVTLNQTQSLQSCKGKYFCNVQN